MPGLTTVPRHTSALASHVMLNGNGAVPASWAEPYARPSFIHAEMVDLPAANVVLAHHLLLSRRAQRGIAHCELTEVATVGEQILNLARCGDGALPGG